MLTTGNGDQKAQAAQFVLARVVDVACSACQAGVTEISHVVLALGYSEDEARGSLRFSLGHSSTIADVAALAAARPEAVSRARAAGRAARATRFDER